MDSIFSLFRAEQQNNFPKGCQIATTFDPNKCSVEIELNENRTVAKSKNKYMLNTVLYAQGMVEKIKYYTRLKLINS